MPNREGKGTGAPENVRALRPKSGAERSDRAIGEEGDAMVTCLEMRSAPPQTPLVHPAERTAILRAEGPTLAYYRFLYEATGRPWFWSVRGALAEPELRAVLDAESLEIFVLYVGGVPAGFAEIDRADPAEVQICHLGMMPEFLGRGLGDYLLEWAVQRAWHPMSEPAAERVWLRVCSLDRPNSLGAWQKAGFRVFDRYALAGVGDNDAPGAP